MGFSRNEQLNAVQVAIESTHSFAVLVAQARRTHLEQTSHLNGFYEEVDKLAKGKTILSATDLITELANNVILDVKGAVFGDTYLNRLKQFVPAGDNPTYPDVLIALRVLQQSLQRFDDLLTTEGGKIKNVAETLEIIRAALYVAQRDELTFSTGDVDQGSEDQPHDDDDENIDAEDDAEEGDEEVDYDEEEDDEDTEAENDSEYHEYVGKEEVSLNLKGFKISNDWFKGYGEREHRYFNFEKLDREGLPTYVPPENGLSFVRGER